MTKVIFTGNFTDPHFSGAKWSKLEKLKTGKIYTIDFVTGLGNFVIKHKGKGLAQERSAFTVLDFIDYEIRGCIDTGEEILSNVENPAFWTLYGLRENNEAPIWEALYDYPSEEAAKTILNKLKREQLTH